MPRDEYKKLRQLKNLELLKSENAKLRKENRILKDKINSMTCPTCNSKMISKKDNSTSGKYISQAASSIGSFISANKSHVLFQLLLLCYSFSQIS